MALLASTAAASKAKFLSKHWKKIVAVFFGVASMFIALIVFTVIGVEEAKTAPSDIALSDIPPVALEAYLAAGDHCVGLTWNVLAGIGKVESNHGRVFGGEFDGAGDVVPPIFGAALNGSGAGGNTTPWPSGQWEGQWGLTGPWLRALGPMQFISPSWSSFGRDGNGDGVENPHNIFDGAFSAAQLLCQSQGGEIDSITDALFSYNRSTEYGELVLHWARLYVALPFASIDGSVDDLLGHPNIELHPRARGDAEAGIVDPRLVSALVAAAEDFQIYIGWFKTGHSECVGGGTISQRPGCTISNHHFGRAVDIGAVGFADGERLAVTPNNEAARALSNRWGVMNLEDPLRPESLGSPWDSGVFHGHFTDGNHLDHLHVAWRTDPPPPPDIEATRHGIDDVERLFPSFQASEWFPPVVLPARASEVQVGPGDIQAAIDNAAPSTRIVLSSGFYPQIRVSNASGLSIVAGGDGVVTFASGEIGRGAGIIVENSSDVAISGLSITDSLWGIQVRNSTDVLLAGNTVSRVGQEAIHVSGGSSNVTVQNNTISYTGQRAGTDPEQGLPYRTFGEGIYIGTGRPAGVDTTNNVQVIGNHIHHTSAEAIEVKPGAFDVAIRRNIIHDTSTQTKGAVVVHVGTTPSVSGNISVRQNLIWNTTATSAFRDGNAIVASGPAHIQANIIWDAQHRGVHVEEVYGSQRAVTVRRNVIFDTPMGDVVVASHSPALTLLSVGDNLDGSILQHPVFEGGWINNDRPTEALALLVSALDNDLVPLSDLESVFAPPVEVAGPIARGDGLWTVAQVIDGTIGAGDGGNPNEESPMGRHDASLFLPQGWNWSQGPSRNSQWGNLGSNQFTEWRCAVIPENGHNPPVDFRVNVQAGAYYQFVNGSWNKAFDVDLTGGNHGGYLGQSGQLNNDPFSSGGHGQIQWRRESDGSFSAPWNSSALMMHFWAGRRQSPASGQTAEFLSSEMRLQQPDGGDVDLSRVKVLFQCGIDYYNTTGGQGTKVPGPGIAKYHRLTESWKPGLWVTLPGSVPASSTADFQRWLEANLPPNVVLDQAARPAATAISGGVLLSGSIDDVGAFGFGQSQSLVTNALEATFGDLIYSDPSNWDDYSVVSSANGNYLRFRSETGNNSRKAFNVPIAPSQEAYLVYSFFLEPGFDAGDGNGSDGQPSWGTGVKMPGLIRGAPGANTGGNHAADGFSGRLMIRGTNSSGSNSAPRDGISLAAYIYGQEIDNRSIASGFGEDYYLLNGFGARPFEGINDGTHGGVGDPRIWDLEVGEWVTVVLGYRVDGDDGWFKAWTSSGGGSLQPRLHVPDVNWTGGDRVDGPDSLLIQQFWGGQGSVWYPDSVSYVRFRDFAVFTSESDALGFAR